MPTLTWCSSSSTRSVFSPHGTLFLVAMLVSKEIFGAAYMEKLSVDESICVCACDSQLFSGGLSAICRELSTQPVTVCCFFFLCTHSFISSQCPGCKVMVFMHPCWSFLKLLEEAIVILVCAQKLDYPRSQSEREQKCLKPISNMAVAHVTHSGKCGYKLFISTSDSVCCIKPLTYMLIFMNMLILEFG